MENVSSSFNIRLLLANLKACSKTRDLERGKKVHAQAVECGHDSNIYVASALMNMYARCGSMVNAHKVFDSMRHPDVVSWTALIFGYAENGQSITALDLFNRMKSGGPAPNSITVVAALKACTSLAVDTESGSSRSECLNRGKELHKLAIENGYDLNIYVQSSLIDMYAKCGLMMEARQVFGSMQHPDVVSWTVLIMGYADNGQGIAALELFILMKNGGPAPNSVTWVAAFKACTSLTLGGVNGVLECRCWGKKIHDLYVENACHSNIYVQNTMIDMYSKCGSMVFAQEVFDSIIRPSLVSWNALIQGYANNGQAITALDLFTTMKPTPNSVTMVAALKSYASLAAGECRDGCKILHALIVENGCVSDIHVQSTLIDTYAKSANMISAQLVFDSIKLPNAVAWTVLIKGYADNGQGLTALELFMRMKPAPDSVTFMAVLRACGLVGGLEFGRRIHSQINNFDVVLVTCLVDFYAKCGSMLEAEAVFNFHAERRVTVTWNALLAGFSGCGSHEHVFELFKGMCDAGFQPDSVTCLCILTCCGHTGLLEKGKECFDEMFTRYGIIPTIEHYTCMVDVFGRANKLDDAMALLQRMPCSPNDVTWTIVLGACHKRKIVKMGRLAFQSVINLNEKDGVAYVLMGQIYGSRGMVQEQEIVMIMKNNC